MPTPTATSVGITFDDIKLIGWLAGGFVSALLAGSSVAWWFNQQLQSTRRDLYTKINTTRRELENDQGKALDSITHNKDDCRDTKERVTLLERDHEHQQEKTDNMDRSLKAIESDLSATKDSVIELSQKSREDTLMIMSEIRATEGRSQLAMMEMKEFLVNIINTRKRKDDE